MIEELQPGQAVVVGVPTVTGVVLRACSQCHAKHPLAHDPPIETGVCPTCGTTAAEPEPLTNVQASFGETA